MNRRSAQRRGYVLLVTLGLLVLSTTLLVAIGRVAVRHAARARIDEKELQRRWALASARVAVLPFAERVLADAEQTENRPVARLRAEVRLGDATLGVVVADENAKANVNEMLTRMPADSVETRLRDAMSGTALFAHVRLRAPPIVKPSPDAERPPPPVGGFGQLFGDVTPASLMRDSGDAAAPIDVVTCWGDGSLNLLRADRASLRLAIAPSLSPLQIDRLIEARDATVAVPRESRLPSPRPAGSVQKASPDAVQRLLDAAKAAPADRARLPLAARSTCHSLRIELNDGRRFWYDLTVADESDPRRPRTSSFVW